MHRDFFFIPRFPINAEVVAIWNTPEINHFRVFIQLILIQLLLTLIIQYEKLMKDPQVWIQLDLRSVIYKYRYENLDNVSPQRLL